jgi:hypothetical protein
VCAKLAGKPTLEARRRLEKLLDHLDAPVADADRLRALRAVEALEHIGTPPAVHLLQTLARGDPDARLTREARAARERLSRRPVPASR